MLRRSDNKGQTIVLVDLNNFYISAERAFEPRLRNRPVVVLSNNDSCIVARSAEVKALGIKMGEPLFKVNALLKKHGVITRSSNYSLYHEMSQRFVQVLEKFCEPSGVQQYSVDECFLVFEGFRGDLQAHCQKAIASVEQWTGMPGCAGMAPTRTLAKVANHFAKTLGVPGGVLGVRAGYHHGQMLRQLPVGDVWGVGRRLEQRLVVEGVKTAWDLSEYHLPSLRSRYGVTLERTALELRGISCIELAGMDEPRQEIVSGRTFGEPVHQFEDLMAAVANHVASTAEKLRAQGGCAGRLTISLQGREGPSGEYRSESTSMAMRPKAQYAVEIVSYARACVEALFRGGKQYRRASVMLQGLEEVEKSQGDLFAGSATGANAAHRCVEAINTRFGRGMATLGSAQLSNGWKMKREQLSPAYTSDFSQLPRAILG